MHDMSRPKDYPMGHARQRDVPAGDGPCTHPQHPARAVKCCHCSKRFRRRGHESGVATCPLCGARAVLLIEDALQAGRAALEEGVIPGGGIAVLRCLPALDKLRETPPGDQRIGPDIVSRALRSPIRQIARTVGKEDSLVLNKVLSSDTANFGYNALTGEYGNFVAMGVIVSTKVERVVLQNSSSIAAILLATEVVVCETKKDEDKRPLRRSA